MFAALRMTQDRLNKREDGFSLVELVVAMVIIAGILMILIGVQLSAATTVTEARKREQATAIANEAIEEMRSIPWAILSKGMYNGFKTAAGGDSNVLSGNVLKLDSGDYTLRVASTTANQNPSAQAWEPLFSSTGSNKQVVTDAQKTGTTFTVRAYVFEPSSAQANTVGIAVLVEWRDNRNNPRSTSIVSTAYRGTGCGSEANSPFLAACQAFFDSASSSGTVSTLVTASTYSGGTGPSTSLNLLYPTSDPFYSFTMRAASAAATMSSQQVSTGAGIVQWGGTTLNDNDDATQPEVEGWTAGYVNSELRASNDASQTTIPFHVSDTTVQQSLGAEPSQTLSDGGTEISFLGRSDFRRTATIGASTTTACLTGIPAGQPCAKSSIANLNTIDGAGYILMDIDGSLIRMSRRLSESGTTANVDSAFAARFTTSGGTSAVGCVTPTGAGCVSAGAERQLAQFSIGAVVGGAWVNPSTGASAAAQGIVVVEGATGCTTGMKESVLVQRGTSHKATAATLTRCGQIRYWTGSAYSTMGLSSASNTSVSTQPVRFTASGVTVTATAQVIVTPGGQKVTGTDVNCVTDACTIFATSGGLRVNVTYVIDDGSTIYVVESSTILDGPQATATFKAAPSA